MSTDAVEYPKPREPFRIKRKTIKDTPNRVTALWIIGMLLFISVPSLGTLIGYYMFWDWGILTCFFALFFTLAVGLVIAWFTLIIQENAQDIQIRVVERG